MMTRLSPVRLIYCLRPFAPGTFDPGRPAHQGTARIRHPVLLPVSDCFFLDGSLASRGTRQGVGPKEPAAPRVVRLARAKRDTQSRSETPNYFVPRRVEPPPRAARQTM